MGYYSHGTNGRLTERVIVIPLISENSEKLTSLERSRELPNGDTESTAPARVKNKVLEICFMRILNLPKISPFVSHLIYLKLRNLIWYEK